MNIPFILASVIVGIILLLVVYWGDEISDTFSEWLDAIEDVIEENWLMLLILIAVVVFVLIGAFLL